MYYGRNFCGDVEIVCKKTNALAGTRIFEGGPRNVKDFGSAAHRPRQQVFLAG